LKFSLDGPDIPTELVDAAIRGEVVFLCGAGVSQPQLPDFKTLTCNVFGRLGLSMGEAEEQSFGQSRFEETLGSLSRRLADRKSLYAAVASELDADVAIKTDAHHTILRLSRDFEGRPAVVTTNFDTLLERALHDAGETSARELSYASAQVPAPGGPRFEGIIHLHGRLADPKLRLDESDLVLTSADYGDAYLRSGWAARFLYDLARTRTIVLVGYSASDAPVRYILNILEADRERFPDLRRIFVLSDCGGREVSTAAAAWDAVAVEPIIFDVDFCSFWRDMAVFADLVESPRLWRKAKITSLTERGFVELSDWEKAQARWILSNPDGVALLGELPFSAHWIAFIREQNLVQADTASDWALCTWAARRLAQRDAFIEVLNALPTVGRQAAGVIDRALDAKNRAPVPDNLERAWRLLTAVSRQGEQVRWNFYAAFDRLGAKCATGDDLLEIIGLFSPRMSITPPYSFHANETDPQDLSSLCRVEFKTRAEPQFNELLDHLPTDSPDLWTLLRLADSALTGALTLARDANMVALDYDAPTFDVPSISDHPQNEHYFGFLPIVRICAELWNRLLLQDASQAKAIANTYMAPRRQRDHDPTVAFHTSS
jgi:SIR2-like domain